MKKILLVIPYNNGTIGLCSLNLYKALINRTDIVSKAVIVHKFEDGYSEFETCEWCHKTGSKGFEKFISGFFQICWLKKIKKQFKPDITISTLDGCSAINVLSGGSDKKIGIFHGPPMQSKLQGSFVYLITLFQFVVIFPFLDKLYCVSEETRKSILNYFKGIKKKKIEVVYNIHDIEKIRKLANERIIEESDIFNNPVILFCGRLDKNKAPDRALKAFIKANLPENTQLVFIGKDTDNMQVYLKKLSDEAGLSKRIHFLGQKNNPYKYMKNSNLTISTSYSEGLPGVLIETLLLKKPIITTNSSEGVWEILSCHNEYNRDLSENYVSKEGVITPNLTNKHIENENNDIINLCKALEYLLCNKNKIDNTDFLFEARLDVDLLLLKYINV